MPKRHTRNPIARRLADGPYFQRQIPSRLHYNRAAQPRVEEEEPMTPEEFAESFNWRLVPRPVFESASDVPDGLRERAAVMDGKWVLYDPLDDADGFMIVGNNPADMALELADILDAPDASDERNLISKFLAQQEVRK